MGSETGKRERENNDCRDRLPLVFSLNTGPIRIVFVSDTNLDPKRWENRAQVKKHRSAPLRTKIISLCIMLMKIPGVIYMSCFILIHVVFVMLVRDTFV